MSYYASGALPWTVSEEDEERFRKFLKRILITLFVLCLIWPWLPVPKPDRKAVEEIPPRLATLMLERRQLPPPPPVAKAQEKVPDIAKPTPEVAKPEKKLEVKEAKKEKEQVEKAQRTEVARQKASRSGLLAFKDDLAELRDNAAPTKFNKDLKPGPGYGTGLGPGVGTAKGPALGAGARSIITSNAANGSGGIVVSKFSQGSGSGGLAGRSTTQVNSPIGGGGGGGGGDGAGGTLHRGGGGKAARSIEDIKLIFDRNKGSIYTLYNRALREDPTLQGKVVVKLTISPAGQVMDCQLISSDLRAPELERKLLVRIKQFDFGAKEVDVMVVTYPIDFLPS